MLTIQEPEYDRCRENYTFLTLGVTILAPNVYAGPKSSVSRGFSNNIESHFKVSVPMCSDVASGAKRNQVLLRIVPGVAAEFLVVDLKI
jgi:hypothetical protein